jgi:hypothetical protein
MAFVIQNLGTGLKHSGQGMDFNAFPESPDPAFPVQGLDPAPARFEAQSRSIPVVFRVGVAYDVLSSAANRLTLGGEFNEYYNNRRRSVSRASTPGRRRTCRWRRRCAAATRTSRTTA